LQVLPLLTLSPEPVISATENIVVATVTAGAFDHRHATLQLALVPVCLRQIMPAPGIARLDLDSPLQVIDGLLVLPIVDRGKRLVMQIRSSL
jgi:hypothetical protein